MSWPLRFLMLSAAWAPGTPAPSSASAPSSRPPSPFFARCERPTRRFLNETLATWPVVATVTVTDVEDDRADASVQTARILVRRVFTGHEYVTAGEDATVRGVGNKQICSSSLLRGSTSILALSITGDSLFLAATPIRMSLHTLDILHSLSTGRPHKKRRRAKHAICETSKCPYGARCSHPSGSCECRSSCRRALFSTPVCGTDSVTYASLCHLSIRACLIDKERQENPLRVAHHGECRKKNPCDDVRCGPGEECVLSEKNDLLSGTCTCPTRCDNYGDSVDSTPVCSSDGEDYRSLCHLRMAACATKRNITLKFFGKCDPCSSQTCARGTVCKIDEGTRTPNCRCSRQCPFDAEPVCATDGKTYENECIMGVAACRTSRPLVVWRRGKCDGSSPCSSLSCAFGESCVIETANATARCACPEECPQILKPVCGMDGSTYDSECDLVRTACLNRKRNHVRHPGNCGQGACSNFVCPSRQACIISKEFGPRCACPECPDELSECKMRQAACINGVPQLYVRYNGVCEGCSRLQCDFYGECVSDARGTGHCSCPACPLTNATLGVTANSDVIGPVCGTDGVTYSSRCHLRAASCRTQKFIMDAFEGKCDSCNRVDCAYGEECRHGTCTCALECPKRTTEGEAVCGEDGVRYPSRCHLALASCHARAPINVQPLHRCHQITAVIESKKDKVESHGKGNEIKEQVPMAAKKPVESAIKEAGCACNPVGSYGPACDQSGQCRCRPGVEGVKCDHCSAGTWGIHLIAKGHTGCTPCGCSVYGSSRLDCEQSSGRCECKPGVRGAKCSECISEQHELTPRGCVKKGEKKMARTCHLLTCYHGATCVADPAPRCACPAVNSGCSDPSSPVCGSDGVTYNNACELERFACTHQLDLVASSLGHCPESEDSDRSTERAVSHSPTTTEAREVTTPSTRLRTASMASASIRITATLGSSCEREADCAHIAQATCVVRSNGAGTCECEKLTIARGEECVLAATAGEKASSTTTEASTTARAEEEKPAPLLAAVQLASDDARITWPSVRMDVRNRVDIEMRIKPSSPDGVVFHWGRVVDGVAAGDFLALILLAWQPTFFWNLGSGIAYVKAPPMASHRWSTIRFGRDLKNGTIQVDDNKIYSTLSQGKNVHLDVSGEAVHLGGLPSKDFLPSRLRPVGGSFRGSVAFLSINQRFFALDKKSYWTSDVRISEDSPCAKEDGICGIQGVCQPRLDDFTCKCRQGFEGENCEQEGVAEERGAFFDGSKEYAYLNRVNETSESSTAANFSLSIKTYSADGHVWWETGAEDFLLIFMRNGVIHMAVNLGNDGALKPVRIRSKRIDDGHWHRIRVEREQRHTRVAVDDEAPLTVVASPGSSQLDTNGLVFLGGRLPSSAQGQRFALKNKFVGCIRGIENNGRRMDARMDTISVSVPHPCKAV